MACQAEQTRNFSQSQINGITVGLSSGTSGQRGLFLVSKAESLEWAGRMLGRMLPQLRGKHRIALLLRANSPLYQTINQGSVQFYYVDVTQTVSQWLSSLESFRPTLLVGSAQALQLCVHQRLFLRPQRVISSAEVLTPSDKKMLAIHFACPMIIYPVIGKF
ncbi:hypothetical protein [Candidatus Regiella endosymbiont of Tuberolachnus salignus]|uniref:hypothetical protein n=1 Tax=Candidatus Regiella endosymbiont of Tuberolachnus salignus TaxID=3077956 RepID=UPI0030D62AAE